MPKFSVLIRRTVTQQVRVALDAEDADEARDNATLAADLGQIADENWEDAPIENGDAFIPDEDDAVQLLEGDES